MAYASGKIIMFGEHAVVYGFPGIALPVKELKTEVTIENSNMFSYSVDRVLYEKEKEKLTELLEFLFFHLNLEQENLHIYINSTLPISSGMGSSAALSIALIRALSGYFHLDLSDEKVNRLAYKSEKLFHGRPSGIDNTVITYERPVYYKDKKVSFIKLKKPLKIVIANTGVKPPTGEVVSDLKIMYLSDKEKYDRLMKEVGKITEEAKTSLEAGNLKKTGELMTKNHTLLKEMNISNNRLDMFVKAALEAGAFGAKLSGAGRGGNIIALADDEKKVINNLNKLTEEVYYTEIK